MTTELTTNNAAALAKRVQNKNQSVNARAAGWGELMRNPEFRASVFEGLPAGTKERMAALVISCFRQNPKLMDCSFPSIVNAIRQCSDAGLVPDGLLGHAYLIPYGQECTVIPGYRGLLELVRRSGQIIEIRTRVVYRCDKFNFAEGDNAYIHHEPKADATPDEVSPDEITHVYLIAKLHGGGIVRSCWSRGQIDAHKERYSQAWRRAEGRKKDSPWHTDWPAMARKTLIRDAVARGELPVSAEVQQMAVRDEVIEADYRRAEESRRYLESQTLDAVADDLDNPPEPVIDYDALRDMLDACENSGDVSAVQAAMSACEGLTEAQTNELTELIESAHLTFADAGGQD